MDKYEELIEVFADNLKKSRDYHIAHIYHAGYVSVVGEYDALYRTRETSIFIDEIFDTPGEMAESLLKNWRWQWFYEHRQDIGKKDYEDIRKLDEDIPEELKEDYQHQLQGLKQKVDAILDNP